MVGADEDRLAELESIAQQLIGRVRFDDPEATLRWLRAMLGTDPIAPVSDSERLMIMLAIAVPDDRTWSDLTLWTYGTGRPDTPEKVKRRRLELAEALDVPGFTRTSGRAA